MNKLSYEVTYEQGNNVVTQICSNEWVQKLQNDPTVVNLKWRAIIRNR